MKNSSLHIPFAKIQGTGNDFILVDNRSGLLENIELSELAPRICDRKFGVGSDGLITFGKNRNGEWVMTYKNPDGSDAGMCGNGARCFVKFAQMLGEINGNEQTGTMEFRVHENLYEAEITGDQIRIRFPLRTKAEAITVDGDSLIQVYTNTEHIVYPVEPEMLDREETLIETGRALRNHESFAPKGTNVNFLYGTAEDRLLLQTYERGVETLTLACGTGAIASALAWHSLQEKPEGDFTYYVRTRGGTIIILFSFDEKTQTYTNISLEGPAEFVFEGTYYL
ncbi:MAG: diaminopimelate epimerase [Balneolaceae bacterium]